MASLVTDLSTRVRQLLLKELPRTQLINYKLTCKLAGQLSPVKGLMELQTHLKKTDSILNQ